MAENSNLGQLGKRQDTKDQAHQGVAASIGSFSSDISPSDISPSDIALEGGAAGPKTSHRDLRSVYERRVPVWFRHAIPRSVLKVPASIPDLRPGLTMGRTNE